MEWKTERRERTVNVMYRCRKCRSARRVAHQVVNDRTYRSDRIGPVSTKQTWTWPDGTEHVGEGYWSPQTCECGRNMEGRAIHGIHNPDIKCGPRCENAVGFQCECSCGGRNHGGSHSGKLLTQ